MNAKQDKMSRDNATLHLKMKQADRRTTKILAPATPVASPAKYSSLTNYSYANLKTPSVSTRQQARLSVGDATGDEYDTLDKDDVDEEADGVGAEEQKVARPHKSRAARSEAAEVAKVVAKAIVKPEKFSGETEKEREGVETWVQDVTAWLDSQFSQFAGDHSEAQWTLVQSLLGGTAKRHMVNAKQTDPSQTWESLKQSLVDFIRGGQESKALWRQKMDRLTLGVKPCENLLQLEKEFEQLRIKLYPTSGSDPAMNAVVGRVYGHAIERGNRPLAAEMARIIALKSTADAEPSLADWKAAAVSAEYILKMQSSGPSAYDARGGRDQPRQYGRQYGGDARAPVNELTETADDEGDAEEPEFVMVQQMEGRKGPPRSSPRQSFRLPPEEYRVVMQKGLCLQCYKVGHRIGEAVCKEKGQARRRPTAAELKA